MEQRRKKLGFPEWDTVKFWLDPGHTAENPSPEEFASPKIKNPEIPLLINYKEDADDRFWKKFP